MKPPLTFLAFFCLIASSSFTQTFLNGSFETTTGTCTYNQSNANFNALISDVYAFGPASQCDIVSNSCAFGSAQNGIRFIGIAVDQNNTNNDALSLVLSSDLLSGSNYTLSLWQRKDGGYTSNSIEIGYSTDSLQFGTIIDTVPAPVTTTTWDSIGIAFSPSVNCRYITIRTIVGTYGWNFIDNFSIIQSCQAVMQTDSTFVCSGQSLEFPDGHIIPNIISDTTYTSYLKTVDQCDSIITSIVSVTLVDTTISHSGNTLTANALGASYQWVDCNNGFTAIPGASSASFSASGSGSYAVIVSQNQCFDTSACMNVTIVGFTANEDFEFELYPNPTTGNVKVPASAKLTSVEIYSMDGKKLSLPMRRDHKSILLDLSELPSGIYFLKAAAGKSTQMRKVVKL